MAQGSATVGTYYNRTRRSRSIPAKLWRERRWHLLPVYYLLLTSDLAREGIAHSGSARFADHLYRNQPSGRWGVGYLLDALLLRLKSARAFRFRYQSACVEIRRLLQSPYASGTPREVLAVPCGYARELFETAKLLRAGQLPGLSALRGYGFDLDGDLIAELQSRSRAPALPLEFWVGDALLSSAYRQQYDMIISMGFTEFLNDEQALEFYGVARRALKPGGILVTSGMQPHRFSEYLMRQFAELTAHYRSAGELEALTRQAGLSVARTYQDPTGLQTMLVATS